MHKPGDSSGPGAVQRCTISYGEYAVNAQQKPEKWPGGKAAAHGTTP